MNHTVTLRDLLQRPQVLMVPGAHDAITARLVAKAGFEAVYVSGSGTSTAVAALPDIGLVTLTEMARLTQYVSQAVSLPIIVDADTGHGSVLGAMHTVRELENAGAAAIHIEDQADPKRCGHLEGKRLVSTEEMVGKIQAAVAARKDPNFMIIARTDARAVEGLEQAIERAKRYVEAGADIIFPEALKTEEEFRAVAKVFDVPLLANMTEFGKTPYHSAADFYGWGYNIVLFPVSALRIANKAVLDFFNVLREAGTQRDMVSRMMTRQELYEVLEYPRYEELEREFLSDSGARL